jgi:hypothetical protein
MTETPTCVLRVDAALIESLDARLGPPLDSYVRGWQVWLEDHGPDGVTLEWRLHPPARFTMPRGVNPHDLFGEVLQALAQTPAPDTDPLPLGKEQRRLTELWEALEVFPTFGDDVSPELLASVVEELLGRHPDASGRVDHGRLGDLYKGRQGDFSVGAALLAELDPRCCSEG